MIAYARVNFGMDREEFLDITPRHFAALKSAHDARVSRSGNLLEYMLAQIAACTVNFSMRGPKQPSTTADFMPSRQERPKAVARRKESKQRIADRLRRQMMALM